MRKSITGADWPVLLSTADGDLGNVPASKAKAEAKAAAKEEGKTVTARDATTDKKIGSAKPNGKTSGFAKSKTPTKKANTTTKAKGTKKAKAAKPARKANGDKQPKGLVVDILKLASRPTGASREELIKLTGWSQQAWKWGFTNSKGTGWCQRWGYKFKVLEGKDGEARYHVEKKAA